MPDLGKIALSYLKDIENNGTSKHIESLRSKLKKTLEPVTIALQGDSTGNGTDEWFYMAMQKVALHNPAYTVLHKLWNDTKQAYDDATYIQYGLSGHGYVQLSGGYLTTPDVASLQITGDIEIIAKINADNYTPATDQMIVSKFGDSGNRGYALELLASGCISFWWSADGTNLIGGNASGMESSVPLTVTNGQDIWIKATLDVDNGSLQRVAKYYTSSNGQTWTQLGSDRIVTGITSFYASTAPLEIGSRSSGVAYFTGKIYVVIVKNGIGGTPVLCVDFGMSFPSVVTSVADLTTGKVIAKQSSVTFGNGSPTLVLLNSSMSGQSSAYSADATRYPKQVPIKPDLLFISYSHNELGTMSYYTLYEALLAKTTTAYPRTGICCCSQNTRKSPATYNLEHSIRCSQIGEIAAYKNIDFVDVYSAFVETGNPDAYVSSDGIHPAQPLGFDIWTKLILKYLKPILF